MVFFFRWRLKDFFGSERKSEPKANQTHRPKIFSHDLITDLNFLSVFHEDRVSHKNYEVYQLENSRNVVDPQTKISPPSFVTF